MRQLARRILQRIAPGYVRRRASHGETVAALARLEADFEHIRRRHTEQIERLEDLARELILAVESLRRASVPPEPGTEE